MGDAVLAAWFLLLIVQAYLFPCALFSHFCLLVCLQLKVCIRLHQANLSAALFSVCLLPIFVSCGDSHSISSLLMSIVSFMLICDVMVAIILDYVYLSL